MVFTTQVSLYRSFINLSHHRLLPNCGHECLSCFVLIVGSTTETTVAMCTSNTTEERGLESATPDSPDGKPASRKPVTVPVEVSVTGAEEPTDNQLSGKSGDDSGDFPSSDMEPTTEDFEENKPTKDSLKDAQVDLDTEAKTPAVENSLPDDTAVPQTGSNDDPVSNRQRDKKPTVVTDGSTRSEPKPRSARSAMFDSVIRNALDPSQHRNATRNRAAALESQKVAAPTDKRSVHYPYRDD